MPSSASKIEGPVKDPQEWKGGGGGGWGMGRTKVCIRPRRMDHMLTDSLAPVK